MRPDADADGPLRVLVLTADVGEGHLAAGRVIAEHLEDLDADVEMADGLVALGVVARHIIRDGYRFQLRWVPWSYSAMYRLFMHVPPARMVGAAVLGGLGSRGLRRLVRRHQPDVVVSTHPAVTCVLGRMRQRRRLAAPLCATITDLADYAVWSHPGADLHLVMHPQAIGPVERIAGPDSAVLIDPLVGRRFLEVGDRESTRVALDLRAQGRIALVSGGGWGVGDLSGAAEISLNAGATDVIVVAGRNAEAEADLRRNFRDDPRVRVLGFTDRMPELMRAADVLVHSTGGMTSLEALACGCPMIAYGTTIGHIRVHNRTMAQLGLITVAETPVQLRTALLRQLGARTSRIVPARDTGDPGALVAGAQPRVRQFAAWRILAERGAAAVACGLAVFLGFSSDVAYSVAARPLRMKPLTHMTTTSPAVALVVRGPASDAAALARALAVRNVHASFALPAPPSRRVRASLDAVEDDVMPELGGTSPVWWLRTRRTLDGATADGPARRYLADPGGLSFGQYLVARSMHARPISGQVWLSGADRRADPSLSAGDIVVVTADARPSRVATDIAALASRLASRGLLVTSVAALSDGSSTTARTMGDDVSTTAAAVTSVSPATIPPGPSGA
jgi:UDP-N-acetylglucosamine:LPS N-acetylglucosamine transferase